MATPDENNQGLMAVILAGGAALFAFLLLRGSGGGGQFSPAHGFSVQPVDPPTAIGTPRRFHFSWVPASAGVMYLDISNDSVFPTGQFVGRSSNGVANQAAGIVENAGQDVVTLISGNVYFMRISTLYQNIFYLDPPGFPIVVTA